VPLQKKKKKKKNEICGVDNCGFQLFHTLSFLGKKNKIMFINFLPLTTNTVPHNMQGRKDKVLLN
jgi:galactokinase